MTNLLRKGSRRFEITDSLIDAFDYLKAALADSFKLANSSTGFSVKQFLVTDASHETVGLALHQAVIEEINPLALFSQ